MHIFVTVESPLIPFPAAIYLQPLCVSSIIISDQQMTLRDGCYLKHMHSSSRQCDGARERGEADGRGGVKRWRGGDPLGSEVLFSCCAHVLCMGLLCIFQGPSGLGVYIYTHTRWCFQLAVNWTIWCRWMCVWKRICWLVWVAPRSKRQKKGERRWARKVTQAYSRDVKEWQGKSEKESGVVWVGDMEAEEGFTWP